ncbi:hypothetical protein QFZ79_002909 [Arthrobacter sp. V4I6]|uniref:hypothetical protein n=1 Tax=Arthrobacter sp. V4I6 TaxID=3042281 RepID=UPI00277D7B0B|nr:hypothetical protein [Arthrobacter sp. V4I6]MDQ0854798.1 hypothetical protein [Arthrobacter sp. V4I6]
MSIPTEPAVHAIAKALWVDHGNNPDNWVYRPPEDLAHYFRVAQIAFDAAAPLIEASARRRAALDLTEVRERESRMPGIRFAVGFLSAAKRA